MVLRVGVGGRGAACCETRRPEQGMSWVPCGAYTDCVHSERALVNECEVRMNVVVVMVEGGRSVDECDREGEGRQEGTAAAI